MFRCPCVQLGSGHSLFVMRLGYWRKAAMHYDVVEKSLCHSSQQHKVLIACWKLTVLIIVISWLHSGLCCQTSAVKVDCIAVRQCVCTVTVLLTVALEFHMDFQEWIFPKQRWLQTSLLWPPCIADADIIFSSCGFFFFFLFFSAYSRPSHVECLPYFHTWCSL